MASNPAFADAIAQIESGGNYGILGPVTKTGDRAYGKYQVMGANVGPWTKEVLGVQLSPQQFLNNPGAQDAVFNAKFGQYADKYGPQGAAQAWFGGPGAVGQTDRKDQLGTSVGHYGEDFMKNLGAPPLPPPVNVPQLPDPRGYQPQQQTSPLAAPQTTQQLPAQASPSMPFELPQGPMLNAPQIAQYAPLIRQFNALRAFQKIPVPAGFKGFSYS